MDSRQDLILRIQQVGFLLVELNLYLNTHPTDKVALMNYNTLVDQYQQLVMQHNTAYGPLLNFGHAPGGTDSFRWIESPWPWQQEANASFGYRG